MLDILLEQKLKTYFKNENLASKEIRKKSVRKPYLKQKKDKGDNETIEILDQKTLQFLSQEKMLKLQPKK